MAFFRFNHAIFALILNLFDYILVIVYIGFQTNSASLAPPAPLNSPRFLENFVPFVKQDLWIHWVIMLLHVMGGAI